MSQYYNPKKTKYLYSPSDKFPFKLSRSKIDLFLECPRCFYLDRRLGVGRPPGFPFALNSAVDALLKKEFDLHRAKNSQHPLQESYGLKNVIPFRHESMDFWRDAMRGGIQYKDVKNNLIITGGIDDIWINTETTEIIIVDYKATSKDSEVNLDADWQIGYKRQVEIYQWLFRQNGFKVCDTAYFVYCNGRADKESFDAKLEFDIKLIPYIGDTSWVEGVVDRAKICLDVLFIPQSGDGCDYCAYHKTLVNEDLMDKKNNFLDISSKNEIQKDSIRIAHESGLTSELEKELLNFKPVEYLGEESKETNTKKKTAKKTVRPTALF